jgi:hypothetical protein
MTIFKGTVVKNYDGAMAKVMAKLEVGKLTPFSHAGASRASCSASATFLSVITLVRLAATGACCAAESRPRSR